MMSGKSCVGGMCMVHKVAAVLVVVGALNWGLVGINADWNLVHLLLGSWMWLERLVYILVGLSGVAMLFACKCCMKDGMCANCGDKHMGMEGEKKM